MTYDNTTQMTLFGDANDDVANHQLTPKPADINSADPKSGDEIISTKSELIKFVETHKSRIWPHQKTRENSFARVARFDAFDDYSDQLTKPEKITDITSMHIYEWLDAEKRTCRTKEGQRHHPKYLSNTSINRYATAMSVVLSFAVEAKLRQDSPKLKYTKEFGRTRYFTDQEVEALITHFVERKDQWMVDLIYVGVNTGMRLSEILSLGIVRCGKNSHWGETEINEDSLYVPASISKNDRGRFVSVNEDVRDAALRLTKSLGQHFTHRKFYSRWDDARAKIAPNDPEFVFHTLRHTCASRMANELAINTLVIKEQLGHASVETTQRYVHSKPETKQAFSKKMTLGKAALVGYA